MANVPYSPVPEANPTLDNGTRLQSSEGITAGAITGGLDKALAGAGDMLFKHAMRMQTEANQARAKDLFLAATTEMADLDNQFRLLEGIEATNAYPKFTEDVNKVREKYKGLAGNTEVSRLFDNDFARRATFTIIDGSRHAATQNRQYNRAASAAVVKNAEADAGANPEPERINDNIELAHKAIDDEGRDRKPPEQLAFEKRMTTSRILAQAIESKAISDPQEARKLFDENRNRIFKETQNKIEAHLKRADISMTSRKLADSIISGGIPDFGPMELTPQWHTAAKVKAREIAKEFYPDNPEFEDMLVSRIETRYNEARRGETEQNTFEKNTVLGAVLGTTTGKPMTSIDQVLNDPALAKLYYDQVEKNPAFARQLNSWFKNQSKVDNTPTKERVELETQLKGMLLTPEGRKEFANYDLSEANLTSTARQQLQLQQIKLKETGKDQVNMQKVLSYPAVRSMLNSAGIVRGKPESAEAKKYDIFIGVLQDQIQTFEQDNKKLPNEKEAEQLIAPILRKTPATGWFSWFRGSEKLIDKTIPSEVLETAKKRYIEKHGEDPPEGYIEKEWIRRQLKGRPNAQ